MSEIVVDFLTAIYKRIEDPMCFTTGVLARDEYGRKVQPNSPVAVCWCVLGAMQKERSINSKYKRMDVYAFMHPVLSSMKIESISEWADGTPHSEVLAGLAKAIEMEKNNGNR